jgi:hypothetical protein
MLLPKDHRRSGHETRTLAIDARIVMIANSGACCFIGLFNRQADLQHEIRYRAIGSADRR